VVIQQFLFKRRDHDGFAQSQSPRHPARELLGKQLIVTLGRPCWTEITRMEDQKR
jgi:hypothetical protein